MNKVVTFLMLLPRNIVVVLLRGYRLVVSPLYGDVCRYYPSCSGYGLQAIQEHGLIVGGFLTARRIARCHPWAAGGIDDVPRRDPARYGLTRFGFVVPAGHGKG